MRCVQRRVHSRDMAVQPDDWHCVRDGNRLHCIEFIFFGNSHVTSSCSNSLALASGLEVVQRP
jgi:hypothetical protein